MERQTGSATTPQYIGNVAAFTKTSQLKTYWYVGLCFPGGRRRSSVTDFAAKNQYHKLCFCCSHPLKKNVYLREVFQND